MINLTKGAIVCADRVSTVSPRYAQELRTEYYSSGLSPVLNLYAPKLCGILNGIDTKYYDPSADPDIAFPYSVKDRKGKAKDKKELQNICGFADSPDTPLVVMVSRLAAHKGFDLVRRILEEFLANNDVQFALLGTGEYELEDYFSDLSRRCPDKCRAVLEYNKALSKKFYAGADLFLMPSKSEPCGLAQMIASRYGAVPVVRETGGLSDTIRPYNEYTGEGNGFSFANYNAHEMMHVLEDALVLYHNKKAWDALVTRVMQMDFSWEASADRYVELYRSMLSETSNLNVKEAFHEGTDH
jgi:starch synthase